jgi:hypothetical protein
MAALTRRELERLSYRHSREDITAAALGVLLTLVWVARNNQALPTRDNLTKFFLGREDVPPRLRNAVQITDRYDGPSLTTYTEMVDFAQQAGVLRRVNPGHVSTSADLGPLEAEHLLQMAMDDFREEIAWLGSVVAMGTTVDASAPLAAA